MLNEDTAEEAAMEEFANLDSLTPNIRHVCQSLQDMTQEQNVQAVRSKIQEITHKLEAIQFTTNDD